MSSAFFAIGNWKEGIKFAGISIICAILAAYELKTVVNLTIQGPKGDISFDINNKSKEVRFSTLGGYKSNRYADKVEFVKNEVVCIHQDGKVSKNGLPVVRESRAIEDIMLSPNYNGAPIYFWPYNSFSGPIIYY